MSAAYGITIFSVRRVDFACQSPTTGHRKGLTSMKIINRNGSEAVFDIMKIITAVTNSNNVVKEDEQLCGSITWLVPDAQKNTMEPILVDLGEEGRTYELLPHQGEEFGYVLSGSIFLVDGETKTRIRAGSSFCLHPHETHYLMNAGKSHAKVLWISTPPSF